MQQNTPTAAATEPDAAPQGPVSPCQYHRLPLRPVPPLGLVRQTRLLSAQLRERVSGIPQPGRPSRYAVGDWVRVRDQGAIRATLDGAERLRGLWFTASQWSYCGRTYQVEHVTRRMMDDHYRMRRISGTVTLSDVSCLGAEHDQGCGLACALLFRDEWLEPSTEQAAQRSAPSAYATVRTLQEIRATLDGNGCVNGVPFHTGMERYAGTRHPLLTRVNHRALPWWQHPVGEWYVLDGLRCQGEPLTAIGCDRQCGLLWHRSWLHLNTPGFPGPARPLD